jgi:hypothetical protein
MELIKRTTEENEQDIGSKSLETTKGNPLKEKN